VRTASETPEAALHGTRMLFVSLGVFSLFVNLLMLT
jgi:ABC-type protease/lipase transport system fused ATPase/permease subunit